MKAEECEEDFAITKAAAKSGLAEAVTGHITFSRIVTTIEFCSSEIRSLAGMRSGVIWPGLRYG